MCKSCDWFGVLYPEGEDPSPEQIEEDRRGVLRELDLHCPNCGEQVELAMLARGRGAGQKVGFCRACESLTFKYKPNQMRLSHEEQAAIVAELRSGRPVAEVEVN
jgi:hypothetical protein